MRKSHDVVRQAALLECRMDLGRRIVLGRSDLRVRRGPLTTPNRNLPDLTPPRPGAGVSQDRDPRLPPGLAAAGLAAALLGLMQRDGIVQPSGKDVLMPVRTIGIIGAGTMDSGIMKVAIATALFVFLGSPSVAQTAAGEIESANQQFAQALNKGDAAMIARMYTEDAVVMPPEAEMIAGREAVQNYWRGVIEAGLKKLSLRSVRVDEYGADAAREIGRFSVEAREPRDQTGTVEGKYVVVWRKSGGRWQHDSDIWNFTEPPEPDVATGTPTVPAAVGSGSASPSR